MRIVIESKALLAAARATSRVCPTRTPLEILQSVKIVASEDDCILIATDNIQTINFRVQCEVDAPGEVICTASKLIQIASSFEGDVTIESTDSGVSFRCDNDRFEINTENPSSHTGKMLSVADGYGHRLYAEDVYASIRRTVFAVDPSNGRYCVGGIALDLPSEGTPYFVATDGRRVTACKISGKSAGGHNCNPQNTVVPDYGMKTVMSALSASEVNEVTVITDASSVTFWCDQFAVSCRLLEGRFPSPWRGMIVDESIEGYNHATVEASELLSAVRKSEILSEEESIGVWFRFGDGMLSLDRDRNSSGQSHVEVDCEGSEVEASVKIYASYFRDWLNAIPGNEEVVLLYAGSDKRVGMKTQHGSYYSQAPMLEAATT